MPKRIAEGVYQIWDMNSPTMHNQLRISPKHVGLADSIEQITSKHNLSEGSNRYVVTVLEINKSELTSQNTFNLKRLGEYIGCQNFNNDILNHESNFTQLYGYCVYELHG